MKKLASFFIGCLLSLFIVEVGLRLSGFIYLKNRQVTPVEKLNNDFRIMCIGNSHTVGIGVLPEQAYPAILEKLFENYNSNKKIRVINNGLIGANSSMLLDSLPQQIENSKPSLVVILTGEPNAWTSYGFSRFIKESKIEINSFATKSVFNNPISILKHLHTFRLLEILFLKDNIYDEFNSFNINEKIMYWRSTYDGTVLSLSNKNAELTKKYLEIFIQGKHFSQISNGRDYLTVLAELYRNHFNNWDRSIELMRQSFYFNQYFDYATYFDLLEIFEKESSHLNPNILKKIKELKTEFDRKYPGDRKYKKIIQLFHYGDDANFSFEELQNALKEIPGSASIQKKLIDRIELQKNLKASAMLDLYTNSLQTLGPFSQLSILFLEKIKLIKASTKDPMIINQIDLFFKKYISTYPSTSQTINYMNSEMLSDWIKYDLDQMTLLLNKKKIPFLILNYHWLRGNILESIVNNAAIEFSKSKGYPYSDVHHYYINYFRNSKLPESAFFASQFGPRDNHPSILGHRVIAEKIKMDILKYKLISE